MTYFGHFYLDKEKDIIADLFMEGETLSYVLRTPNHKSGNLLTNLARLCDLPLSFDGLSIYSAGEIRRAPIFSRTGRLSAKPISPPLPKH